MKKTIVEYGEAMRFGSFRRGLNNLFLFPAWFFPWKKARVFFHKLRGVSMGKNVEIGYMVILDNRRPELIRLDDNVFVTAKCIVLAHDLSNKNSTGKETIGRVHIKEGAFIGMNSVILPGVTIGIKSIVGAGSVVSKDTEDGSIYIGTAARRIK